MFSEKKYVFIFVLCFLTTILCFSHLSAKEVSMKTLSDQQKAESTEEKAPLKKQPQITIDATRHDAGEIYEGESIVHSFTVKNTGTTELNIKRVKAG